MDVSRKLIDRRSSSEEVVLLPYTLSIVDCFFLHQAFSEAMTEKDFRFHSDVGGIVGETRISSVYDLYRFDRDIDEVAVFLADVHGNFLHWDENARFVAVGGSRAFCSSAVPYPQDVRKHYLLEGMMTLVADDEIEELYRNLTLP